MAKKRSIRDFFKSWAPPSQIPRDEDDLSDTIIVASEYRGIFSLRVLTS